MNISNKMFFVHKEGFFKAFQGKDFSYLKQFTALKVKKSMDLGKKDNSDICHMLAMLCSMKKHIDMKS